MLREQIDADMRVAMKARTQERVDVLRLLRSALENERIAQKGELNDVQTVAVLQREAKKRRDAAEQYRTGGRPELAEKEDAERGIIAHYLPTPLAPAEVQQRIDALLAAHPDLRSPANMGKVMGQLMAQLKGQADGSVVRELVRTALKEDS